MNIDQKKSKKIRKDIIDLSYSTNSPHLGSSLSCVEILVTVFSLTSKIENCEIIFSKGHAALAYYSAMKNFNFLKKKYMLQFLKPKTKLWSHVTKYTNNKYLKFSFGSLGYGLGISAGISLSYIEQKKKHKIFCILSDGEMNEGSIWESLMFISHHNLKNIIILIDHNKWQSFGKTKDVLNIYPLKPKLIKFGFSVFDVDGHNVNLMKKIIKKKYLKPLILICNTIKGKGIDRIENTLESHYHPAKKNDTLIF